MLTGWTNQNSSWQTTIAEPLCMTPPLPQSNCSGLKSTDVTPVSFNLQWPEMNRCHLCLRQPAVFGNQLTPPLPRLTCSCLSMNSTASLVSAFHSQWGSWLSRLTLPDAQIRGSMEPNFFPDSMGGITLRAGKQPQSQYWTFFTCIISGSLAHPRSTFWTLSSLSCLCKIQGFAARKVTTAMWWFAEKFYLIGIYFLISNRFRNIPQNAYPCIMIKPYRQPSLVVVVVCKGDEP